MASIKLRLNIRFRSLVYQLPLLTSSAAHMTNSEYVPKPAPVPDDSASNGIYSTEFARKYIRTPDGSMIELNVNSSVVVYFNATTRMVVLLSGEAQFTVVHDSRRPFRVFSGRNYAEDVGTIFSATKRSTTTTFLVKEGEIAVFDSAGLDLDGNAPADPNHLALNKLHRGERMELSDESGAQLSHSLLTDDEVSRMLAWTEGRVIFANTPLDEAVAELNRYSRTKIVLAKGTQEDRLRIGTSFVTGDVDGFLDGLRHLCELSTAKNKCATHSAKSTGPDGNPIIVLSVTYSGKDPKQH